MKPPIDTETGLGLTSAAGPGQFLLQTSDPTIAGGGNLSQTPAGSVLVGIGTDFYPAQAGGLRTIRNQDVVFPGDTLTDIQIGHAAVAAGGAMVAIGTQATGQGGSGIVIGNTAFLVNAAGLFAIGSFARALVSNGLALGNNARAGSAALAADTDAHALGNGAVCQGGGSVAVGANAFIGTAGLFTRSVALGTSAAVNDGALRGIAIGYNAVVQAAHDDAILIGMNQLTDKRRTFRVGNGAPGLPLFETFFGGQDTYASYEGITHRHCNGSGVDNAVGPAQWIAPRGTGNTRAAVGGNFPGLEYYSGSTQGGSGAGLQPAALRLAIRPSDPTGVQDDGVWLELQNFPSKAGAAAGTLANAPTAGDPALWVPFVHGGVTYAFPAWQV
jgi:hypothetical protein